jgi:hypothetical protein
MPVPEPMLRATLRPGAPCQVKLRLQVGCRKGTVVSKSGSLDRRP